MASSTQQTQPQPTAAQKALTEKRAALIARVATEDKTIEGLKGRKDDKAQNARWSAGARKANRKVEIKAVELDMAIEGMTVTPYEGTKPSSKLEPMTQAEIEGNLAKVRAVLANPQTPESVKHTATNRIKSLLASAKKRGYTVS